MKIKGSKEIQKMLREIHEHEKWLVEGEETIKNGFYIGAPGSFIIPFVKIGNKGWVYRA